MKLDTNLLKEEFPKLDLGLTDEERDILSYYALTDGLGEVIDILKLKLCHSAAERDELLKGLENRGFLGLRYPFWRGNRFEITEDYFIPILIDTLLYYPDITKKASKSFKSERRKVVDAVLEDNQKQLKRLLEYEYNVRDVRYLCPVMGKKSFDAAFEALPEDLLEPITEVFLSKWLMQKKHPDSALTILDEFSKDYLIDDEIDRAFGKVDCYRFFLNGTVASDMDMNNSEWPHAIAAIQDLYKGNYDNALANFEKYLKIRNQNSRVKNIADTPILSYYLIMCYILVNTEKTRKKIEQYRNKKLEPIDGYNQSPGLFLVRADGMEDRFMKELANCYLGNEYEYNCSTDLIAAICASRGLTTDYKIDSDFAIIKYETSSYNGIDQNEKEALEKLYGGSPLIDRLKINKPWEALISVLEAAMGEEKADAPAVMRERRLVYFVDTYNYTLKPKLQIVTKSGKWSAGKVLPIYALKSGDYDDAFEPVDKTIVQTADSSNIYMSTAFPYLVGTDRVFYDNRQDIRQVSIIEELPYLSLDLDKKSGDYAFSTNAQTDYYDKRYESVTVLKRSVTEYVVIRLNPNQQRILGQIHNMNTTFPVQAEPTLRQLLPRLGKIIEVHSPLLDSGSSLKDMDADSKLFVRIIPQGQNFLLSLYVRPLDGGQLIFFRGKGGADIYDSNSTGRFHVLRKLKDEKSILKEFLPNSQLDVIDGEEGRYLLTANELLPVVKASKEMSDRVSLEWPEGRSLTIRGKLTPDKFRVNVDARENWFEVEGNAVSSEGQQFTLDQILAAISAGGYDSGFLKLGEDEYVELSESLAKYVKRLESITAGSHGRVSVFQTGILADILDKSHMDAEVDEKLEDTMAKMKEATKMNPAMPTGLKAELRDYQEEGYRWMVRLDHWGAGACLADDMGLGKTVQTIAFLLYKAEKGASLVVAPASVLMNWQRELQRFAPSLDIVILNEAGDRTKALDKIGKYTVVLTTYGLLAKEQEMLENISWNVVCLDEAHTIKNRDTKMSVAAMSLKATSRIILTGTPVQNYLGELWNLFQFINPGLLGSYDNFNKKFIIPIEQLQDKDRQSQLKRIIQPFMLRRTKSEVVEELPEKTEIQRTVALTPAETVAYETMRMTAQKEIEGESKINVNALAAITRLREAACAMSLVKKGWKDEPSKVIALMDLVQEIISGGNSVLVFSQFTGFLDIVSSALTQAGIAHFYLNGAIPIRKRQEMVADFQHGVRPVFLISLKAGGLGLNLTGANYVIHLDPWWNPAIEQQATDRAYRIGQQQNVTVYHLIAQGTIEEKILRLHKAKQNLADAVLEGTSSSHAITLDELRELLK